MKKANLFVSLLTAGSLLALTACNNDSSSTTTSSDTTMTTDTAMGSMHSGDSAMTTMPESKNAEATISGTFADTTVSGTAKFEKLDNGKVKMELELTIPAKANKSVAVHIHEHGDCGDTAKNAHGHWNPTGAQHGKWGSASFHAGDIGNVKLDGKGKGKMDLETDLWNIGGDEKKNILNRSIIVHGGQDDYTTQPSGNSGTRIGCGLISVKN